jgi:hypothetical protein
VPRLRGGKSSDWLRQALGEYSVCRSGGSQMADPHAAVDLATATGPNGRLGCW